MDRIWTRHFRLPPPPATAPPDPDAPPSPDVHAPEANALKSRLLPPPPAGGPPALEGMRITQATLATAIGQGGCFGLAFALLNQLRVRGNPAVMGVAGLVLPSLAGYLTAPAQRSLFEALDFESTQPPQRARWHEAIPSVCFYAVNLLHAQGRFLARPVPGTPGAAITTLLVSMTSTALAGAACEASAQWVGGKPTPRPDDGEVHRTGVGRALALLPMGLANLRIAAHLTQAGRVPDAFRMRPLQVGLIGWAVRKDLTPPEPDGASRHEPAPTDDA